MNIVCQIEWDSQGYDATSWAKDLQVVKDSILPDVPVWVNPDLEVCVLITSVDPRALNEPTELIYLKGDGVPCTTSAESLAWAILGSLGEIDSSDEEVAEIQAEISPDLWQRYDNLSAWIAEATEEIL